MSTQEYTTSRSKYEKLSSTYLSSQQAEQKESKKLRDLVLAAEVSVMNCLADHNIPPNVISSPTWRAMLDHIRAAGRTSNILIGIPSPPGVGIIKYCTSSNAFESSFIE